MPRFTNVYTNFAFAKKSSAFIAALPPDVRRRLASPERLCSVAALPLVRPSASHFVYSLARVMPNRRSKNAAVALFTFTRFACRMK